MLCAVLIPSRGRPEGLKRTVLSVFETADDPERIEVRVRLDDDDPTSREVLAELIKLPTVREIVGKRGRGYPDVNKFYTELALMGAMTGNGDGEDADWIWIMNDDAVITGRGWDTQLSRVPKTGVIAQPELYQLNASKYYNSEGGAFPLVPNRCWESFGEKEIPDPADSQLDSLLRLQNGWRTQFLAGVGVVHDRPGDEELEQHRALEK